MSADTHRAAVCEDHPYARQAICETVASLGHEPIPLATLDEMKAFLAKGELPCYWIQDMEMPHSPGARPHPKVGETGMRMVRAMSNGKYRVPIIVLTGHRSDVDFVMNAGRLEADDFIEKANGEVLGDRILRWLKERGRERHADCAGCNARSRPKEEAGEDEPRGEEKGKEPVARLLAHDGVRAVSAEELERVIARRKELDSISQRAG